MEVGDCMTKVEAAFSTSRATVAASVALPPACASGIMRMMVTAMLAGATWKPR